jgi:hypothetical protein
MTGDLRQPVADAEAKVGGHPAAALPQRVIAAQRRIERSANAGTMAIVAAAMIATALLGWIVARFASTPWAVLMVVSAVIGTAAALRRWRRWNALTDANNGDAHVAARWAAGVLANWAQQQGGDEGARGATIALAARLRSAVELSVTSADHPFIEQIYFEALPAMAPLDQLVDALVRRQQRLFALPAVMAIFAVTLLGTGLLNRAPATPTTGQSVPSVIEVGTLVGDLRLDVSLPAYARDSAEEVDDFSDDATVLRDSTVRVSAAPLPGYVALQVEIERPGAPAQRLLPTPDGDGRLAFAVVVNGPVGYRFVGASRDGKRYRETALRTLRDRADELPKVRLISPAFEVEVRADDAVIIDGRVDDDLGLASVDLVVARPAGGLERRSVAINVGDRRVTVRESVEVNRLELRPGELATVWLEARDLKEAASARVSSSERVTLRMFSAERHHASLIDRLGLLATAWTFALADRLEGDPAVRIVALPKAIVDQAVWARNEATLTEQIAAAREDVAVDVLARAQSSSDLEAIERRLRDAHGDEERVISRTRVGAEGAAAARELARVGRAHQHVVDATERAVVGLAGLAAAEHRNALARDGRALEALDQRLQALLKALKAAPNDPALRAEAERVIDAMAARIEQMANEAARQTALTPPEHLNAGALEPAALDSALDGRKDALDAVRTALRDGRPADALAALANSRARLQDAMTALQAQVDAERTAEDAALERLIAQLRAGIAAARVAESDVRDQVRQPAEAQERASAEHLRKSMRQAVATIQALLSDARDQIRPKHLRSQEMRGSRAIANARASLSQAAAAVDAIDVDGALMALNEAEGQLGTARQQLMAPRSAEQRQSGDVIARSQLDDDATRVGAAGDRAARAAAALRVALPRPEALHDAATRRRLAGFARAQAKIRKRLERVRARLSRASSRNPGLDAQVGGRMEHAGQMMRQAAGALEISDAAAGQRRMQEAIAALETAERLMQQRGNAPQPRDGGGIDGRKAAFSPMQAPVRVGAGNQNDTSDDFRQRLLQAEQRRAPEGWSERVRRYWRAVSD